MADSLKLNAVNYIRPVPGSYIGCGIYGNGIVCDYNALPYLVDTGPMQPPESYAQQKTPYLPNGNLRADTRPQQRAALYGPESLQPRGQHTGTPPASHHEHHGQSPQLRRHLHQFQQQQQQPQNWSRGNFLHAGNNHTLLNPSGFQAWPGYFMMSSPDLSVPFGFGLGPLDIN